MPKRHYLLIIFLMPLLLWARDSSTARNTCQAGAVKESGLKSPENKDVELYGVRGINKIHW